MESVLLTPAEARQVVTSATDEKLTEFIDTKKCRAAVLAAILAPVDYTYLNGESE